MHRQLAQSLQLCPLSAFSINTASFDGASGSIEKLTFDLSGTHCTDVSCILGESLVFGGAGGGTFVYDPEFNGPSSLFGTVGSTVFGFDFTGFDPLNVSTFSWDLDVASNGDYAAIVAELAGTVITASVRFDGGDVFTYSGTRGMSGVALPLTSFPFRNLKPMRCCWQVLV